MLLGVSALLAYLVLVWVGAHAYAHRRSRRLEEEGDSAGAAVWRNKSHHMSRITTGRFLTVLDLVFAPVSQMVVAVFACRSIGGVHYLGADLTTVCYDRQ